MKKVVSIVLAVLMLASLSVFAFADADVVNPSVETKAAPEVDEASNVIEGVEVEKPVFELIVPSFEIPENASDDVKAELEQKVAAVKDVLDSVNGNQEMLNAIVNGALEVESARTADENAYDKSENAVASVSDLFFFDVKDDNGVSVLASEYVEGETPAVKVWVKIELPDNLMKVVQLVGDTWVEVPVVLNENGESGLEFSYSGVVLFVYNSNVEKG